MVVALALLGAAVQGEDPYDRAADLVRDMSLDEKLSLVHGDGMFGLRSNYSGGTPAIARLGIPALQMNDGPQGFRDPLYPGTTTQWPSGLTVAATFDAGLARAWGAAMGAEFAAKGANVQLGPGMNVARVPTNGRNFEVIRA